MERTKLFYINIDGEDTYLIAEGEDEAAAARNAVKEFQKIQKIYGEQNLPITNITRMDKIVDNWNESVYNINIIERDICHSLLE